MAEKLPKHPTLKIPNDLGKCVDLLKATSLKRLAEQKKVDLIAADEKAIKEYIINNVPKSSNGVMGKEYKAVVITEDVPQVEDWTAFYAYVHKNKAFDLLNRAINKKAIEERHADLKPKTVAGKKVAALLPGIKLFKAVKLSVTKL